MLFELLFFVVSSVFSTPTFPVATSAVAPVIPAVAGFGYGGLPYGLGAYPYAGFGLGAYPYAGLGVGYNPLLGW